MLVIAFGHMLGDFGHMLGDLGRVQSVILLGNESYHKEQTIL